MEYTLIFFLSEEARRALLQKIKSDGMSEDDVTKLMSVFDNQGKTEQIYIWTIESYFQYK